MRFPLIIVTIAGLISATGFAPLGLWPLTLIALALLMHLVARAPSLKSALLRGWLFGVGHFTVGLNWIAHAFTFQDAMPHWLGYPAVAVLALYLAVYPAAAAGLAWRWGISPLSRSSRAKSMDAGDGDKGVSTSLDTNGVGYVLIFAAAWIVTEWLRATMFTGFAWNPLGAIWVGLNPARLAPVLGTYGLSGFTFVIVGLVVGYLYPWAIELKEWPRNFRSMRADGTWPTAIMGPLLIAGMLGLLIYSFFVPLPSGFEQEQNGNRVIRLVQPNIGTEDKYDTRLDARNFSTLANLTVRDKPAANAVPRLILWPEGAIPEPPYLEEEAFARARLAALLGPRDILMTGGTKRHRVREVKGDIVEEYTIGGRNSTYAIDARGRLLHRYDKAHLVPYGEYLPARPILTAIGLSRLIPGDIDFWPGPGPRTHVLPGFGKVGHQICYEIVFSGQVVDRANRPDFLFNPSNDAWFGSWGPPQHLAQARLRAIEEGLAVVRSTPTGISAVIDANGRLLETIPSNTAGFIETRLPPAHAPTPFARFGNILPFVLAIFLAALGVALRRRAR